MATSSELAKQADHLALKGRVDVLEAGGGAGTSLPSTLSVLGDSIAAGLWNLGAGGGASSAFAAIIGSIQGWTVYNHAIDGSTVAAGTNGHNPMVNLVGTVVADNPGRALISGGTNDFNFNVPLGVMGSTESSTFYGAYYNLATGILNGCAAALYCVTPFTRDPTNGAITEFDSGGFSNNPNTTGANLEQYRQAIRDVVRHLQTHGYAGRIFVLDGGRDLYPWFKSQRSTYMDSSTGYHPVSAGHTLIGHWAAAQMDPALTTTATATPPPVDPPPTALHSYDMVQGADVNLVYDRVGSTNLTISGSNMSYNTRGLVTTGGAYATGSMSGALTGDFALTLAGMWSGAGSNGLVGFSTGTGSSNHDILAAGLKLVPGTAYGAYTNSSDDMAAGTPTNGAAFVMTVRYVAASQVLSAWVNGILIGQRTTSPLSINGGRLDLGAFNSPSALPWYGELYGARVDGAITDAQIRGLYQAYKTNLAGRGIGLP